MLRAVVTPFVLTALLLSGFSSSQAARSRLSLHRVWTHSLSENADSVPAYLPRVSLPHGGTRGVVYVLAGNNASNCDSRDPVRTATLYALDSANGSQMWSQSTRGSSRCTTAGPAIDPNGAWVYAPGLDGKMHRYSAATGEETRSGRWPVTLTLMPSIEKIAANPTIGTGHLYVTTSGFIGDAGHYQGHLITIDLATGKSRVFNSLCSNIKQLLGPTTGTANYCTYDKSGLFGRGEGAVDSVTHDVYIIAGNGPWNGRTNWGDSLLKLDPSGSRLLDSYTPTNQRQLEAADADLGSTGPALLPPVSKQGRTYHLLVQGGKGPACDNCHGVALRLLNRDNLSGQGGPGHLGGDLQDVTAPGGCPVLTAPAVWAPSSGGVWIFYANDCGAAGYRLTSTSQGFSLSRAWSMGQGGTTPVMSHGVLYVARSGGLAGYDPRSGAVLWHGNFGDVHWQYPLIRGGRLFLGDQSRHVSAFSIAGR